MDVNCDILTQISCHYLKIYRYICYISIEYSPNSYYIISLRRKEGLIILVARKTGEYVVIGEDIIIRVVNADEGELKLEIDVPKGMDIVPGEVCNDTYQIPPPAPQLKSTINKQEDERQVIDKIAVWKDNGIILLDPSTILYFTMVKKKVVAYTKEGTFECNSTLEDLQGKLFYRGFFRCHRSFVINMDYVDKIMPWFNSTYMMKLKAEAEQIPVSRHYTKSLRSLLSI
jgi:Response regulator of the LytR/AlgR family